MTEDKKIINARKRNMKLYSIYRMISTDIVFLYAIEMLFLTQINGVNASDIVFSLSMYAFFMVIMQVPATMIIQKIGYVKSAFISNVANVMHIVMLMISTNVWMLIFAQFISAITFSLKDVAEPSLLNASIPKTTKKGNIYSKIEGKGKARYNYLDGISNIIAGTTYAINPYIPIILAIIFASLACVLSLQFEEIKDKENKESSKNIVKEYLNDIKISFKFIFKSNRLKGLLLYSGLMWGVVCIASTYKDSILIDIGTSSILIGVIGAMLGIASAIGSKKQRDFHNKFRNKSLTYISISLVVSVILSGLIVILKAPFILQITVIVISFIIIKMDNSMNLILIERYLGNFSNNKILPKIYSANAIVKNIVRMTVGILGSMLMSITKSANAMFIVGIISLIIVTIVLKYMSTRVGLKPDEYDKKDIEISV